MGEIGRVSILVLVDVALELNQGVNDPSPPDMVSILVLVDVALEFLDHPTSTVMETSASSTC